MSNHDLHYQVVVDAWRFFKYYMDLTPTDASYWKQMVDAADLIANRYNNNTFVLKIMCCMLDELERIKMEEYEQ